MIFLLNPLFPEFLQVNSSTLYQFRASIPFPIHYSLNLMCIGLCVIVIDEEENQLDATQYFIALVIGSTCFGHHNAHCQELATILPITAWAVWHLGCWWSEGQVQGGWLFKFLDNIPAHKFHLSLLGSLASRKTWRHLVATVGMSKHTGG
jgi:hypothetical protein